MINLLGHRLKECDCNLPGCKFCDGGLAYCERCHGGEDELSVACAVRLEEQLAQATKHLDATRAMLRSECDDLGASTTWADNLHLADVVEKHLCRPVRDDLASLRKQVRDLNIKLQALAKPSIQKPAHVEQEALDVLFARVARDGDWIAMCQRHGIEVRSC